MEYQELTSILKKQGFSRVERDDRLLDVFSQETLEKGIELWEKWDYDTVHISRIHEPKQPLSLKQFKFSRQKIETALLINIQLKLTSKKGRKS